MLDFDGMPQAEACAIQLIIDADDVCRQAKASGNASDVAAADRRLRAAISRASDNGVSWQKIGDALGIRRGNAYQRFRRRSRPPLASNPRPFPRSGRDLP